MRKNGWQLPFHVLQIATWVVFPGIIALFFIFYTPILDKTVAIILSVVYTSACGFAVVAVALCTGTDPSDDCILRPSVGSAVFYLCLFYKNVFFVEKTLFTFFTTEGYRLLTRTVLFLLSRRPLMRETVIQKTECTATSACNTCT